jgi:hypothetical protein
MQPTYLALVKLFGAETRYTVPLFQRPYVWSEEEQWQGLWDDLADLAVRVLTGDPDKPIAGHFLGTVVLEQAKSRTGSIVPREIIDGQQRLTTLQIVLKAAEHALAEIETGAASPHDEALVKATRLAARQLAALTANPAYAAEEEKYKVWPTNDDRAAFRAVMDAGGADGLQAVQTRLADAYRFFLENIRVWLNAAPAAAARAAALAAALKDHLRMIVLDLDDTDEPQAIFETLNAGGAPLLPADLIKNWLLWEGARQKMKMQAIEALYQSYWHPFDADSNYWRTKVGTGHAARERVDLFLQNWLTRRTGEAIPSKHIYARFLSHAAPRARNGDTPPQCDVTALMEDIHVDGQCYRTIDDPTGATRFDTFLRRLAKLDVVVFYPLLMALMRRQGSDTADRDAAAVALESYLVRRVICAEQTRGYGTYVLTLLEALHAVPASKPAAPAIVAALSDTSSETFIWPDDAKFKDAWCTSKFYGGYRRMRVQMILEALEDYYQREGVKGEPIVSFDFSTLEIEHVMPQKWERHWPLPTVENAREDRARRLHGIGNLTLVSGKLNPTLSNANWLDTPEGKQGKRTTLDDHSKLQLNARLVKTHRQKWDEAAIDARAAKLFEAALKIWPGPEP